MICARLRVYRVVLNIRFGRVGTTVLFVLVFDTAREYTGSKGLFVYPNGLYNLNYFWRII
jgi:hypothetical protein